LSVSVAQRTGMALVCALVSVTMWWHSAIAQNTAPTGRNVAAGASLNQPKIDDLLTSLAREWLKGRNAATPAAAFEQTEGISALGYLSSGAETIRNQVITLARAAPGLPGEFRQVVARMVAVDGSRALIDLGIFSVFVLAFYAFCRQRTARLRRGIDALPLQTVGNRAHAIAVRFASAFVPVGSLIVGSALPLFFLGWQPIARATVFGFAIAIVLICSTVAIGDLLLSPNDERFRIIAIGSATARFYYRRLIWLTSALAVIWVVVHEAITLGFSDNGQEVIGYTLGLGAVGLALEAIWQRPDERQPPKAPHGLGRTVCNGLLSGSVVLLWVLWVAAPGVTSVEPAFWSVFVCATLPLLILVSRRAIAHLFRPSDDGPTIGEPTVVEVSVEHGLRALLIIGAAGLLAWGWNVDLMHLAARNTMFDAITHGVLTTLIILLLADVLWRIVRTAIDSRLAANSVLEQLNSNEARRIARLHTLLPIFRNLLFVFIIAVAAMMALAELGVEIGPLIAGASIVGVAIGFGAQTFVRDIIAGMFYLLDDAFRVGEYIQSNNYKGTVEGFSIRSIRLRHHRGPIYTVPFSLLGAIQNQSRDWVIDKLMVGITYDSDLERARKLIKRIGLELAENPDFAPLIIEPLKMQGVEELGDFAVKIRMKMTTLPGEQFVIRRKAYAMIKKGFDDNGIKFAFPTIQVAGAAEMLAAAERETLEELVKPAAE
jgi:moderate conductance mechanosensitive channel